VAARCAEDANAILHVEGIQTMTTTLSAIPLLNHQTNLAMLRGQMRRALTSWVEFAEPEWNLFAALFHMRSVQDREHILLPDASLDELCFICSGLLRAYYLADTGAESNKAFIVENEFAGLLPTAALDTPVICGIQALEPTTLLVARYTDVAALFDKHPVFSQYQRKLTSWLLSRKEVRTRSLLQGGARERYLDFVERYPRLVGRVPQYHIASHLGITEVHLSRLRKALTHEHLA
jgi:CRP-like cAMP-binding protein